MNGKAHKEDTLGVMIEAAHQYIESPDVRNGVIAKCHQEIGLVMVGAPTHQRAAIRLTSQESAAILHAVRSWRLNKRT